MKNKEESSDYIERYSGGLRNAENPELIQKFSEKNIEGPLPLGEVVEFDIAHLRVSLRAQSIYREDFDVERQQAYADEIYNDINERFHLAKKDLSELEDFTINITRVDGSTETFSIHDLLPNDLPIFFRNSKEGDQKAYFSLDSNASFLYLNSPPLNLLSVLSLLHEIGHYYSFQSYSELEKYGIALASGLFDADDSRAQALKLQDERNANAFALQLSRHFLYDREYGSNIKPEEIIELLHQVSLDPYEDNIQQMRELFRGIKESERASLRDRHFFDKIKQPEIAEKFINKLQSRDLNSQNLWEFVFELGSAEKYEINDILHFSEIALTDFPNQASRIEKAVEDFTLAIWQLTTYRKMIEVGDDARRASGRTEEGKPFYYWLKKKQSPDEFSEEIEKIREKCKRQIAIICQSLMEAKILLENRVDSTP